MIQLGPFQGRVRNSKIITFNGKNVEEQVLKIFLKKIPLIPLKLLHLFLTLIVIVASKLREFSLQS